MRLPHTVFVYTDRTRGLKLVNVELVAPQRSLRFAFARELPSGNFDFRHVDIERLYAGRTRDVAITALRDTIATLPAVVTSADGRSTGDPLNLVFVGSEHDLLTVLVRAGWDFTDVTTAGSMGRMLSAFFSGSSYRTSPPTGRRRAPSPCSTGSARARRASGRCAVRTATCCRSPTRPTRGSPSRRLPAR